MLRSVAALVLDQVAVFEFGVICEVFGLDRTRDGVPNFDFRVCGEEPGVPLRTTVGVSLIPEHGLDGLADADLVALPARPFTKGYPPEALEAVRAAWERGATVLTVCSGVFIAGAAGLLDGRRCTTHWMYTDELARRYPTATVDRDVLFVDDGDLITSAGTAAGIDACLHLVRRELGSEITNKIARRMVVPPQRTGGQRQFIPQPVPDVAADGFGGLFDWLIENIDQSHTVADLAARVHMSTRTFARKFADQTGVTPMRWIIDQRVLLARRLLEETDLDVDAVAARSGFGTAILLRHHFRRGVGITPTDYRKAFAVAAS
ncbi:helix-turn-helix domain-containing protein [Mycobacteroides immunogenum]|uniref:AraC family transcriptional regulator n=1 Tax=Mycobacteroides immunogenum TaxID=83262 RepID=A0A0N1CH66_9MYCO|nr:helix-turn-helix domain-containing protein [Mycobacteroides immunogenum]AMT69527.1 AraC family transcriptional regulator [Mycobacteroides immunogenum]ANO02570.1 AraC family transcriptional regulator [Mycobacteroides immunogenum]KIU37596.1 AraC family transcriptional regulator [Mycobacteroides immunogenum]KPG02489.1 AraC family transcriptional regulator [Mycobacteroides immunogenum]KPG02557.1 AraC family transcriptional regulator [Mycobacteroides immunogenum]